MIMMRMVSSGGLAVATGFSLRSGVTRSTVQSVVTFAYVMAASDIDTSWLRHGRQRTIDEQAEGATRPRLQSDTKACDMRDEQNSHAQAMDAVPITPRQRWMVGVGLAIPALLLVAALVLFLLTPAVTRMLVDGLLHPPIANTVPPAIFADQLLSERAPDRAETNRQLTARLQRQFPVGTTEATLKQTLLAQGFRPIEPPPNCVQPVQNGEPLRTDRPVAVCPPQDRSKSLKYEWRNGGCDATIWIRWSTDASEVVTLLDGYYNSACL
jgi:hypothetical protein